MVIDQSLADRFIKQYTLFLTVIYRAELEEDVDFDNLMPYLVTARGLYIEDRGWLDRFIESNPNLLDLDIVDALRNLEVTQWFYLKDTTKYSLFVNPDESGSYAVLGLTNSLKEITGGGCVSTKTGITRLGNHYICDGLLQNLVWLGKNIKQSCNDLYKQNKEDGLFFK